MKHFKLSVLALIAIFGFSSCSDDDSNPVPVNEEEVITTVTTVFIPLGGGSTVTLTARDLDGDGPEEPVITTSGAFTTGTVYNGSVTFLNELVNPFEDITEEVEAEGTEHQVFFTQAQGIAGVFAYTDEDANGNPVGLSFTFTASEMPSTSLLTISLVHEPNKGIQTVIDGNITEAGGTVDAVARFNVNVVAL